MMILTRRKFFSLLAAPAIVKVSSLMPLRGEPLHSLRMFIDGVETFADDSWFNFGDGDWTLECTLRKVAVGGLIIDKAHVKSPIDFIPAVNFEKLAGTLDDNGWHHFTVAMGKRTGHEDISR